MLPEVEEARRRVASWMSAISSSKAFHSDRPLHKMGTGQELLLDDLETLLKATAPRKQKKLFLPSAERRVRRYDPSTSFVAALSNTTDSAHILYLQIRTTLRHSTSSGGLTDEELISYISSIVPNSTPSGVRSRRAELVEAGWVEDSGIRRRTKANRPAIVWRAVVDGQ